MSLSKDQLIALDEYNKTLVLFEVFKIACSNLKKNPHTCVCVDDTEVQNEMNRIMTSDHEVKMVIKIPDVYTIIDSNY